MTPNSTSKAEKLDLLSKIDRLSEETKLFLFGTISATSLVLGITCGYIVSCLNPDPPVPSKTLLINALTYELRASSDKEYCKILVERLMELERTEIGNRVVVNLPAEAVAAVNSSGK